jgi:hypothetical protein
MPPLCSIVGSTLLPLALLLVLQPLLPLLQLLLLLRSRVGDCMPLVVEGLQARVEVEVEVELELQVVEAAAS